MALQVRVFLEGFIIPSYFGLTTQDLAKHWGIKSLAYSLIITVIQVFKNEKGRDSYEYDRVSILYLLCKRFIFFRSALNYLSEVE